MPDTNAFCLDFAEIRLDDIGRVGGKNASLGEMYGALKPLGVGVLDGFATTAAAWWRLVQERDLHARLRDAFAQFDHEDVDQLAQRSARAREAVLDTPLPQELCEPIRTAYRRLCTRLGRAPELAVRSSATAEDLPEASFAGAAETYLNVRGEDDLLRAVHACYASLFTDRAVSYRARLGYGQLQVALSVGVMPMVRSDIGSSGVMFTLDTESGFRDVVVVTAAWGLGEYVVKGVTTPDEWIVYKPALGGARQPIIGRTMGSKDRRLVYAATEARTRGESVDEADRRRWCLPDEQVIQLARWAALIEQHYSRRAGHPQPMDVEWARDGGTGELFIVQARPETVHSTRPRGAAAEVYRLHADHGPPLLKGQAVGEKVGVGRVRVVRDPGALATVQAGEVLVAQSTDPDWEPVMRRVAAIVTDQGGRTAHAAIVSREFGLPCIVGSGDGTARLADGTEVTVSCAEGAEGHVYAGSIGYDVERIDAALVPATRTQIMLNVGDPSQAFSLAQIPNAGVGLARIEFIITDHVGIHPMALARYPRIADDAAREEIARRIGDEPAPEFFVRHLAEGVATIAAAFAPRPVIVRMSDFKTNEYARLVGGAEFEPDEENPMLGFRGASRYYDERYAAGFELECKAIGRVRGDMGLTNVKVMIPFCRTLDEARRTLEAMAAHGLVQHRDGLEVYAMCELPAHIILAREFLELFDGYSIGSNDLTQLTLGIDRDSGTISHLFDERNDAVRRSIAHAIGTARAMGRPIGICGQAPSDYPEFAEWLVEQGITSISLNPDAAIRTALRVATVEARLKPAG
ncbi:MAG: phosphoenolpyruvate synthase [Gammaproteobacteria bacterium]